MNKARKKNLERTKILKANAEFLPFNSGSFDRYVSNGLLEMADNPDWVFNKAYRVLNSGGIAGFSLHGRMGLCTSLRLYKVLSMRMRLRSQVQDLNFDLNDPDKVKDLAKRAGFSKVLYFYEVQAI